MATVDASATLEEKVSQTSMNSCLSRYYRCPEQYAQLASKKDPLAVDGYFRFGRDTTCYGSCSGKRLPKQPDGDLYDALGDVVIEDGTVHLPFDPTQAIDNLYREEYVGEWRQGSLSALARIYYFLRPLLSVGIRRHLQRFHLREWDKIPFPHWPVDCSVDNLLEQLLLLSLRASGVERIPFIWFWPEGSSSCAIMTHDVETAMGRDTCAALMDIDDSFGIKASFQVVPEERYGVSPEFLQSIRRRGFEVAVHDLNHDGHLYRDLQQFQKRAAKINAYGKQYGADGFRAGVLYRKQVWYDSLDFAYDMSVPNVAHLDPQHGGCCTVMPYFIGNILELPVTTTQDYSLFNILHEYSIDLWKRQIDLIMEKHGLMSFIVHPDYVVKAQERDVYERLLSYLRGLGKEKDVWLSTPGEVNRWWRQRDQMTLVSDENGWRIEGAGSDRACIAYASEQDGQLHFSLETANLAR
jgi:hypothetical protein